MKRPPGLGFTVAFVAGIVVGAAFWDQQMTRSRRDLFARSPWRRMAALGYLSAHPSVETARLLRDYHSWETRASLRRRARMLLRAMETHLH
ncbi:MAG: hypothetical protein PVSMB1_10050 [Gemmatimonadaceae bacterium]